MFGKIFKILQYLLEYVYDFFRMVRYNYHSPFETSDKKIFYRIIILAHTVEKGLSIDDTRRMFGQQKITELIQLCRSYQGEHGSLPLDMAVGALNAYLKFHNYKYLGDNEFLDLISNFVAEVESINLKQDRYGGVSTSQYKVQEYPNDDAIRFLQSRFSCRSFSNEVVSEELIYEILELAKHTPSQCNRQAVRVHCFQDKLKISKLLELQGGSAGFQDKVANLFIITSELSGWGGPGQRSQGYVDGALFAMNLMYSALAYGVFTCPLNLAITNKQEFEIRQQADIHPRERLIMMIAFGFPSSDTVKKAISPRLSGKELVVIH